MSDDGNRAAGAAFWAPYTPDETAPWDLRRVVHLHRRAGFAAAWDEIRRDLRDGPAASIGRVLAGKGSGPLPPEEFGRAADALADAAVGSGEPGRLKAWWVYRMLFGPDPLTERLTLLWHGHFATSNLKVNDLAAMRWQNETLRRYARAPFGELLRAALRDPALLVWLDAPVNRKGHPNENLARELMELFTLGIGHYTEADVKEAARTLTGWALADGTFREDAAQHDDGEKVVMGRRGRWRGDDLVRLLLEHPATARRLAWRVGDLLMGEGAVPVAGLDALADGLRRHDLDVGWAVETVLRSRAFFAPANVGTRVLGPVEYVVGAARALELFRPPASSFLLADWAARLGQDLFYPPNVGGWPGGRGWVSPHTMIGRSNFAAALVDGGLNRAAEPFDVLGLARRHGRGTDVIGFYSDLILGTRPGPASAQPADLRRTVALILASPEAQLG